MQSHLIETTNTAEYTSKINAFLGRKDVSLRHISHSTCTMAGVIYYSCLILYTGSEKP